MFNLDEFEKFKLRMEEQSIPRQSLFLPNYIFQDILLTLDPYESKKRHMEEIISVLKNFKRDISNE